MTDPRSEEAEQLVLTVDALRAAHRTEAPESVDEAPKRSFRNEGTPARPAPSNPATQPQKDFIRNLLAERVGNPDAEVVRGRLNEWRDQGGLTKAGASWAIETLKKVPKNAAAPAAPSNDAPGGSATERNRSAADYTEAIWPGIYTVESGDAPSGHYTFRVELQAPDADFAPGQLVIGLLTGPNNEADYTSFGFVKGGRLMVWKKKADLVSPAVRAAADRLLADPNAEGIIQSKFCLRCGATLSVPASVAAGLGPECIKKGW